MPVVGRFYSIIISMNPLDSEHNPPHVHVSYNEFKAIINIKNCELLKGKLPKNALRLALEFVKQHKDELLSMWSNQEFKLLDFKE